MKTKSIIRIGIVALFGILSIIIARNIYASIEEKHDEISKIKSADRLVIERLKHIREAQKIYFDSHKKYCNDWDELKEYLTIGELAVMEVKERVTTQDRDVKVDTLSVEPALEVFRQKTGLTRNGIKDLDKVPLSGETFILWTNRMQGAELLEVQDPNPINPRRQKDGDLKPLRFGSKAAATLKGNWE